MKNEIDKLVIMRAATFLTIGFAVGLSTFAYAQSENASVVKLPQEIEFKGPLSGPPQTVVLYGDPTKALLLRLSGCLTQGVEILPGWLGRGSERR